MRYLALALLVVCVACGSAEKSEEPKKDEVATEAEVKEEAMGGGESAAGASSGISVTDVRKQDDGKFSATLNGAIVFRNLEIVKAEDGRDKLFFPKTSTKEDQDFRCVYLNDRGIADLIKDAVKANSAKGKTTAKDLKITEIRWKALDSTGKLKGFADVTFNDAITIKGLKLIDTKKGLWVAWPSIRQGEDYLDLVFSTDKGLRDLVEAEVKKKSEL